MKCIFYNIIQVKHHLFPSLSGIRTIFSFVLSWRKKCDTASYHVSYGKVFCVVAGKQSPCPAMVWGALSGWNKASGTLAVTENLLVNAAGHWEKFARKWWYFSGKMRLLWAFPFTKPMFQGWCNSSFGGFVLLVFFPCGVKVANPALVITTKFQCRCQVSSLPATLAAKVHGVFACLFVCLFFCICRPA